MARLRSVPSVVAQRGELIVERDPVRPSGRLLRDGGMEASYVDLADPLHLEFDYLRWMRIVLGVARARRVLHVGGGACTLARALAVADRRGRQEVCEIDPGVLAIAREHLGLRRAAGLRVRHVDGRVHVAAQPADSWDAIVIDAYVGAAVPRRVVTVQALADARRVAALAAINVVDNRAGRVMRRVAAGLADVYPRVWALGGRGGNTVLVGTVADLNLTRIAAAAAADPSPARLTPPEELAPLLATAAACRDEEDG